MSIYTDRTDTQTAYGAGMGRTGHERDEPGRQTNRLHGGQTDGAFPRSALSTPMFAGKDIAGLIGAAVITLGPLAANAVGWGV